MLASTVRRGARVRLDSGLRHKDLGSSPAVRVKQRGERVPGRQYSGVLNEPRASPEMSERSN
jgi:hypothetical protein